MAKFLYLFDNGDIDQDETSEYHHEVYRGAAAEEAEGMNVYEETMEFREGSVVTIPFDERVRRVWHGNQNLNRGKTQDSVERGT